MELSPGGVLFVLVGYAFEGVYDHGFRDEISAFAVPAFPGAFLVSKHGPPQAGHKSSDSSPWPEF